MKKRIVALTVACMVLANTIPALAYQPKIIGKVLSTDIVAYVDDQPIRSYNYQDHTYIMAEDLRNYGFKVDWNGKARTLNITLPAERTVKRLSYEEETELEKRDTPGKKRFDVYQTDIQVLFDGKPIPNEDNIKTSVNVNGNTLVLLSTLKHFGEVKWDAERRTSSLYTTGKICATDFGLKYQETEHIALNHYWFRLCDGQHVFDNPAYGNEREYQKREALQLGMIGGITVGYSSLKEDDVHDNKSVYYILVDKNFRDTFQIAFTQHDDNKLQLNSGLHKDFIGITNADAIVTQQQDTVYKTNLSLYQNGRILEMPDFPTFLSINHELYINSALLEEVLDMKVNDDPEYCGWNIVFTK